MAGTREGGLLARDTNRKKYGKDFYREIGAKGGHAKVPKGFAMMTRKQRSIAGVKGGSISKRGKAK